MDVEMEMWRWRCGDGDVDVEMEMWRWRYEDGDVDGDRFHFIDSLDSHVSGWLRSAGLQF